MAEALDRIPELDGLRGIAILMVLVFHISPIAEKFSDQKFTSWVTSFSSMGWSGVDLFFVLSGFLISTILIRAKAKPNYFRNFYARRILRIFPVYYLTVTVLILINFFAGWIDLSTTLKTAISFYSYTGNWLYAFNNVPGFYFEHLWSVAIEEQFYLIWPIVILKLESKQIYRVGFLTMFQTLMVRVCMVFFGQEYGNTFSYFSTISRLDGLMLGSMIALGFQTGSIDKFSKDASKILFISIALVGVCIVYKPSSLLWNNELMLTVGFSGLALLSGALVIMAQTKTENHLLRKFLRHPVLLFFGKYSYALYLFHWPVLFLMMSLFLKIGSVGFIYWCLFTITCYLSTILLALLSWNLVEQRVLKHKHYFV